MIAKHSSLPSLQRIHQEAIYQSQRLDNHSQTRNVRMCWALGHVEGAVRSPTHLGSQGSFRGGGDLGAAL